ncbi:MAG: NAD(+) synthase [Oligoflexales bacterium]|nr:NAD(+) synthase [Oligoflexales bacterium]
MITNITQFLDYLCTEIRTHADIAVLGMSGGADSSLTSILCSLALGKEKVYSVHMPATAIDLAKFNKNSLAVAERLGVHVVQIPIEKISDSIKDAVCAGLKVSSLDPINAGNARSRARMACLYGVAHHLAPSAEGRVRVVGTGNLSEDFIGYDTKGGDTLADFFPIGDLFKSEVYQLLEYFRDEGVISESMIDRNPSAGLWEGQTDEEELGHSYNEMETSVRKILDGSYDASHASEIDQFVMNRHIAHKHKHLAPPVIKARQFCK